MIEHPYRKLQDVVEDELFPAVDMALRKGRHVDQSDMDQYTFLVDAQALLEPFYRRYGCELVKSPDGYFYLVPLGPGLPRRTLRPGAMLAGQVLALLYLDPTTVQNAGLVERAAVLELLASLVGEEQLLVALNPRRKKRTAHHKDEELVRDELDRGLRTLEELGFLDAVEGERLRLRAPLLRFADPVRTLEDPAAALARMVAGGQAFLEESPEEGDEA